MIKILLIAYYFPPLGGIASIRGLKYAKYLRDSGIEPIVLSVHPRFLRAPKDKSLLQELPDGIEIHRSKCFDLSWLMKLLYGFRLYKAVEFLRKNVFIPDLEVTWIPGAKRMIEKIMGLHPDIRIALISAGPFSSLFLGKYLKSKHELPYICEFRDEWTNNPERVNIRYPASSLRRELLWEADALMSCSGMVYLTEIMKNNFISRYPFLAKRPGQVIPNGFDESDFIELERENQISPRKTDSTLQQFRIVYCGSFYDRRQPNKLWESLLRLHQMQKIDLNKVRFDIYGNNSKRFVLGAYADNKQISNSVVLHPFLSHKESITEMLTADVLLLYIADGINTASILTGKIFDYIRSGKPILAIIPNPGLAAEIVQKSKTGFVAAPSNSDAIDKVVIHLYELWQDGLLDQIKADFEYISRFQRKKLTAQLAELIETCLK